MAATLITHRALPSLYGMTREMFTPIFLTLFGGESDFIPEVEKWFNGKTEMYCKDQFKQKEFLPSAPEEP